MPLLKDCCPPLFFFHLGLDFVFPLHAVVQGAGFLRRGIKLADFLEVLLPSPPVFLHLQCNSDHTCKRLETKQE